jgi:hypothetical protein
MSIATNWATSAEERRLPFPCDGLIPDADAVYYRGVSIAAPAAVVFRWLCQLKVGSYSYDRISHPGRRSPHELVPGLDDLAPGQRMMTVFEIVDFERDRHITLRLMFDTAEARMYGRFIAALALSYLVLPRGDGGCRLLAKMPVRYRRGPLGWPARVFTPWLDFPMTRKQLLTFKRLAERSAAPVT